MFRPEDLPEVSELIRKNQEHDDFPDDYIRRMIMDDYDFDPELHLVARNSIGIAGFISGVYRKTSRLGDNQGWIKMLAVDSPFRARGIGSQLLEKIERKIERFKPTCIRVMDSAPFSFRPGIAPEYTGAYCFFRRHGYRTIRENIGVDVDLNRAPMDTRKEEFHFKDKGIFFRICEQGDHEDLLRLLSDHFSPVWHYTYKDRFSELCPMTVIAHTEKQLVGFASHGFTTLLDFGPVGTHPDFRGKGIAGVLTKKILSMIKKIGVEKAFISWVGPVCFYHKTIGAAISRIYWVMAKGELPEGGVEHICEM